MRKYIMEFLKAQGPSMIFSESEKHGTHCSYISRIWTTREGEVKVFTCYFNDITIFEQNEQSSVLLIGKGDNSLFSRLSRKIKTYQSLEEMERPSPIDPKMMSQVFGLSSERFVDTVLREGRMHGTEQCELKDFSILNLSLGACGCLVRIGSVIDNFVLFVNRTNKLSICSEVSTTVYFFDDVFGKYFDFDWSEYDGQF